MNRLFVAAVAAGMAGSATVLGGAGVAAAETAFIVPGTAPSPYPALQKLYHFNPASQPAIGEHYYDSAGATREVIPYPGALWPLTGMDSPTLAQSVGDGTNALDSGIRSTSGPVAVSGLSQGVLALNAEQARLANDPSAPPADQLTFVKAGNPDHMFTKYFKPGSTIPVLDYTVPVPVESQYDTVEVVGQYDIFSDPLDRPSNLIALANAVVAGGTSHTATAFSDPTGLPPQNVSVTTNSRGATTTTYFMPADQLPLTQYLQDSGMSAGMAASLDAFLRPMVDRAYGPAPARSGVQLADLRNVANENPLNAISNANDAISNGSNAISVGNNVISAGNQAVNAYNVANQVRRVLPQNGVALPKVPTLPKILKLPKGKKK